MAVLEWPTEIWNAVLEHLEPPSVDFDDLVASAQALQDHA